MAPPPKYALRVGAKRNLVADRSAGFSIYFRRRPFQQVSANRMGDG